MKFAVTKATAEANNLSAVADAKDTYTQLMEEVCGGTKPYLNTATMESEHRRVKDKAITQFQNKRKMGGEEFSERYKEQLEKDLEEHFEQFKAHNESKNIFKAARTPAVFFAISVIFYISSGLFGLFGAYTIANLFNIGMALSFLTLATWAYIRYSGELREVGLHIDEIANLIWDNFMKPVVQTYVETGIQQMAAEVAERTVLNATSATSNGKKES